MDRTRYRALQDDPLPCITAVDIRSALKGIKANTGKGADGVGPEYIASLPDQALDELGKLLVSMENRAIIPLRFMQHVVALLGKPAGIGERPIALLTFAYRLWIRVRKPLGGIL